MRHKFLVPCSFTELFGLGLDDKLSILGNILLTMEASRTSNSFLADRAKVILYSAIELSCTLQFFLYRLE